MANQQDQQSVLDYIAKYMHALRTRYDEKKGILVRMIDTLKHTYGPDL
jgi:hypothetical protein